MLANSNMADPDKGLRLLATGALLMIQELEKQEFFSDEQSAALGEMIDNFRS